MQLDPYRNVWVWAWHRAGEHRARWAVGGIVWTVLFIFATSVIATPTNPTWTQRLWNGLLGLAIAACVLLVVTLVYAVIVAPYEQRNALRRRGTPKSSPPPTIVVGDGGTLNYFAASGSVPTSTAGADAVVDITGQ